MRLPKKRDFALGCAPQISLIHDTIISHSGVSLQPNGFREGVRNFKVVPDV
jgi:hypothetical protein